MTLDRRLLALLAVTAVVAVLFCGTGTRVGVARADGTVTQTFTVSTSSDAWIDTGIALTSGESAVIVVTGDGSCGTGPDCQVGGPAGSGQTCAGRVYGPIPPGPVPDQPYGSVDGQIGTGSPFLIGAGTTAQGEGDLRLIYNDCSGYYSDNTGSYTVAVTTPTTSTTTGVTCKAQPTPAGSYSCTSTVTPASVVGDALPSGSVAWSAPTPA